MISNIYKFLGVEVLIFMVFVTILDGIINHLGFYFIDGFVFSGYFWSDIPTMLACVIVYVIMVLYFNSVIGEKEYHLNEITDFSEKMPKSEYPSITELKVENEGDEYVCRFRVHLGEKHTYINTIRGNTRNDCIDNVYDTIKKILHYED